MSQTTPNISPEIMRPVTAFLGFMSLILLGFVLHVGAHIFVPFAVAVIIWYLINALANGFAAIPMPKDKHLPGWLRYIFSFAVIVFFIIIIVQLIGTNIADLKHSLPQYQANAGRIIESFSSLIGLEETPDIGYMLAEIDLTPYMTQLISALTGLAGSMGLILVYVIFLLLEQRVFSIKINYLFTDEEKEQSIRHMLSKIQKQIQQYLVIKTIVSMVTGVISYIVLKLVGVDYAIFWAFVIFLLNYIPTVGSMIAVLFPTILALVQFDSFMPATILIISLAAVQFAIGNVIEPRLMGNTLNLSPLVILLSLALWGSLWGIVGMFLCVPLTVIMLIICSNFERTKWIAVLCSSAGNVENFISRNN